MSFGDSSFIGGHVGIGHKMSLKYIRNLAKYIPDISPRETRPTTKEIKAQNKWRTSPKSNQTNSTPHQTTMGQDKKFTGGHQSKRDVIWPSQGALHPNLSRLALTLVG